MIQGTTPTFLFKFSVNLDLISEWRICFAQEGKENLIKTSQDCIIDENQVIYVKLTQEETFAFETTKYVKLKVKALTKDNNVIPSQTLTLTVCEMLDKVLFEIENTPPTKIDTSIIDFEFDTEPCGFGLDFEDLYIEKVSGGASDITVDDKLSLTSTNPVQNKVVTQAINSAQADASDAKEISLENQSQITSLGNQIQDKQDKLILDEVPTENSTNFVNSGGIAAEFRNFSTGYNQYIDNTLDQFEQYMDNKHASKEDLASKQDKLALTPSTLIGVNAIGEIWNFKIAQDIPGVETDSEAIVNVAILQNTLGNALGEIETALDEIANLQNRYINGGTTE